MQVGDRFISENHVVGGLLRDDRIVQKAAANKKPPARLPYVQRASDDHKAATTPLWPEPNGLVSVFWEELVFWFKRGLAVRQSGVLHASLVRKSDQAVVYP